MFSTIRQSNFMLAGLILFIIGVALCPHASHAALPHADVADDAHADCDHEPIPHAASHDHDHCEFDAGHSHDFRLLPSLDREPVLRVVAIMPQNDMSKAMVSARAFALRAPEVLQTRLVALDSIRLRI